MAATLSVLLERVKAWRARRGRPEKARIAIRRTDVSPGRGRITGIVVVDRRQRGDLVDDRPAFLPVEPGEHWITVLFGCPRAARPGKHRLSRRIKVGPGEVVELVCGVKAGWKELHAAARRRVGTLAAITYLVPAIAWIFRQGVTEDLLRMMTSCHLPAGLVDRAGAALRSPGGFLFMLFVCVWIPCMVLSVRASLWGKRASSDLGESYFLVELSGGMSD